MSQDLYLLRPVADSGLERENNTIWEDLKE